MVQASLGKHDQETQDKLNMYSRFIGEWMNSAFDQFEENPLKCTTVFNEIDEQYVNIDHLRNNT